MLSPFFSLSPLFFCKNRLFLFCALCSPMSGTWRLPKCVPTQSQPYPAHFGPKSDFSNFRRWPFGGQCVTTIFGPITISIFVSELQPVMLVTFFSKKSLPGPTVSLCLSLTALACFAHGLYDYQDYFVYLKSEILNKCD